MKNKDAQKPIHIDYSRYEACCKMYPHLVYRYGQNSEEVNSLKVVARVFKPEHDATEFENASLKNNGIAI